MSEKSLRGTGSGPDQARDPAAPGQGRSADSGGAPVEPWAGERTDRVGGREASGPRVSLLPGVPPSDGRVDAESSTADTKRVDSGRTTLMGMRSPLADRDKPTAKGHEVHLASEKGRLADARSVAASGVIPTVELDPSSTRRIGKVEAPGRSGGDADGATSAAGSERKKSDATVRVPDQRSMAAATATFRGAAQTDENPAPPDPTGERESARGSWVADRTQEFHLDPPAPNRAFAKALITGVVLAIGTGIMVQSFIRARVRGSAESAELVRTANTLPPAQPAPPALDDAPPTEPANVAPAPPTAPPQKETETPPTQQPPEPAPAEIADDTEAAGEAARAERHAAVRAKAATPAGRPAPSARTPRASSPIGRPGLSPFPNPTPPPVPAALPATPTTPPPLSAVPAERPPSRVEPPRADPGTKPYDPDMPLPPSAE